MIGGTHFCSGDNNIPAIVGFRGPNNALLDLADRLRDEGYVPHDMLFDYDYKTTLKHLLQIFDEKKVRYLVFYTNCQELLGLFLFLCKEYNFKYRIETI